VLEDVPRHPSTPQHSPISTPNSTACGSAFPAGVLGERRLGKGIPQAILATDTKERGRRTLEDG
jgi:hypothetical protein